MGFSPARWYHLVGIFMRALMGLIKDRHGTYCARRKVPDRLQAAVARVLDNGKERQVWLKKSLGTKVLAEANVRAKAVLMEFDRIIARAEEQLIQLPLRAGLSAVEIKRMAEYHYAQKLASHDEYLRVAPEEARAARNLEHDMVWDEPVPAFGLSQELIADANATLPVLLQEAEAELAKGNIAHVTFQIGRMLDAFQINLDHKSSAYRELGIALLRAQVRAIRAIQQRHAGEPIETPRLPVINGVPSISGETLGAALEGWKKSKNPRPYALREFAYAIRRFIELHGDMPVRAITRKTVREFREALQQLPLRRVGSLRRGTLPELVEWSRKHPEAQKVSPATVNKLLGATQAVALWARDNGLIPDDVPWADPFSRMRLEEPDPQREPWEPHELRVLFGSLIFTDGARPKAGGGDAAFWLPLLGIFTGARLGELAPLSAADVFTDEATGILAISISEDVETGKRLKTRGSRRIIPVHAELVRLGFVDFVEKVKRERGCDARLFPQLNPGPRGGFGEAWSKWFGRYIRGLGIRNRDRVFHSFRHGFKDALRSARVSEDINDALTGHAGGNSVARGYGAKDMLRRFGLPALADAVSKVAYPGLDLSYLKPDAG
jgi:integrase